jgi:fatty acid amide hydrolase
MNSADEPPAVDALSLSILKASASQLAARIASGELTSYQVVEAFIERIEQVDKSLNAVVIRRFDEARQEAQEADRRQQQGASLGPLHGVPVTLKECFHLAGTDSTIGLGRLVDQPAARDGLHVRRFREAGAIVLGKTNIPQMMLFHECINPVYGRTLNPWDLERTPGGSSGGEAAIIAAHGSPLGLGSDLGGSLRIPAHFCGIHALKPTNGRLPRHGIEGNLFGMESILFQPGPMSRHVEDLVLAMDLLVGKPHEQRELRETPGPIPAVADVKLEGLRIAAWDNDGYFRPSPAIRRAVHDAAQWLGEKGAILSWLKPPDMDELIEIYYGILAADGGKDAHRLVAGSTLHPAMRRLLRIARTPNWIKGPLVSLLRLFGENYTAQLMAAARGISAHNYWQLTHRMNEFNRRFTEQLDEADCQAIICPPHGLAGISHDLPVDLLAAASYAFFGNLVGFPAGVVATTRVREGEESDREASRDSVIKKASRSEENSAGLPVGVQVLARPWREDIVLAIMLALESSAREQDEYPELEIRG